MKKIVAINIHSIIDVITNSSTEIFIIDKEKILENFKEFINDLLENSEWSVPYTFFRVFNYEEYIEDRKSFIIDKECDLNNVIIIETDNNTAYKLIKLIFEGAIIEMQNY